MTIYDHLRPLSLVYRLIIIFCVGVSGSIDASTASTSPSDTLLAIYTLAKKNDHQFASDRAQYLANSEFTAIHRGALRPQISGTASVSKTEAHATGTLSQETDTDAVTYGVSLTQDIINNTTWHTYQQGKEQDKLAAMTFQASEQSLMIRTTQAYFNILRAQDQLATSKAEEKAQATLLEQTKQRYEVGLISINDVHETQAAYDSAVANAIDSSAQLGIQYDTLTVLTGTFHTAIRPLKTDFKASAPTPDTQEAWVDFAIDNNVTLKASEINTRISQLDEKVAGSAYQPTLTGSISYNNSDSNNDIPGGVSADSRTDTTTFSLNFTLPLYAGGSLSALERQAAQGAVSAREDYLFTRRSIIQRTRSLFLSVTTDIAQVKARQQAIVSSKSALSATRAGYDAGTRDIVDVVNAQRNVFQSQRDYFDSLYNYIINTLLLKEAAGNLQVSDLVRLEQSLALR